VVRKTHRRDFGRKTWQSRAALDSTAWGGSMGVEVKLFACSMGSVLHPTLERKAHMSHEEKTTRSVKLDEEEVSEEIVNDSLGEVTPADSTGLDSKDEVRKREHPASGVR